MARAGLSKNRKFLRLARGLNASACGMGELLARGVLETMWSAAYERADDFLGDADDVEIVACWRGERGALVEMLLGAGGVESAGFIEFDESRGGYRVHDLWDHAPPWVKRKMQAEQTRRAEGKTISDLRREARLKGLRKQEGEDLPATGRQMVDQLPAKSQPWDGTGRDGTGRDGTGIPPVAPQGGEGLALVSPPVRRPTAGNEGARRVLDEINRERQRVMPKARVLGPTPENLRHITDRLKSNSVEDCLHVVAVVAAGVEADSSTSRWFDAVTPFRPDNFARNLARQVEEHVPTATEYQPCTATPDEIAAQEELERQRGADFLAGRRATP